LLLRRTPNESNQFPESIAGLAQLSEWPAVGGHLHLAYGLENNQTMGVCENNKNHPMFNRSPVFNTTHWSVVLQAAGGASAAALERLCQTYWYPLYAFARRQGHSPHDAEDMTQGFFEVFLSKHYLDDVDREKGRFRSFLLVSFKHYLANEWKKGTRQKHGGQFRTISFDAIVAEERYRHEPATESSPELAFDRRWARSILGTVLQRLRGEFDQAGKSDRFEALSALLFQEPPPGEYARLAAQWKVTESGVRSSVQRIRQRYAALFREEIANTVNDPRDVDGEIAHLLAGLKE
jgi:RNA polymerase sigma-70 factor (ECF subfamily)